MDRYFRYSVKLGEGRFNFLFSAFKISFFDYKNSRHVFGGIPLITDQFLKIIIVLEIFKSYLKKSKITVFLFYFKFG